MAFFGRQLRLKADRTLLRSQVWTRFYAAAGPMRDPMTGEFTALPDIQPGRLEFIQNEKPTPPPPSKSLVFGHTFTDHMLTIPWNAISGWGAPKIEPYGPLSLYPSSTVLHYAQTVFEGMKAYRNERGQVTLFRPDMNMKRMAMSAARVALPSFNGDALLELIKRLVQTDKHWIPQEPGYSLYIRPALIGTQKAIGVSPPTDALLFVICSPVGPYYPNGFKPVALYGTIDYIRAAYGGTGHYKVGANYAPGVLPQREAAAKGYDQNLWLHGPEHYLTEVGTMNMFVVFRRGDAVELASPPLDGMILPGITRDSVLTLAREHVSGKKTLPNLPKNLIVSERHISMKEVKDSAASNNLIEIFGSGTAAVISTVNRIGYEGEDINVPVEADGMGTIAREIWKELVGRQVGNIESDWSVSVDE